MANKTTTAKLNQRVNELQETVDKLSNENRVIKGHIFNIFKTNKAFKRRLGQLNARGLGLSTPELDRLTIKHDKEYDNLTKLVTYHNAVFLALESQMLIIEAMLDLDDDENYLGYKKQLADKLERPESKTSQVTDWIKKKDEKKINTQLQLPDKTKTTKKKDMTPKKEIKKEDKDKDNGKDKKIIEEISVDMFDFSDIDKSSKIKKKSI